LKFDCSISEPCDWYKLNSVIFCKVKDEYGDLSNIANRMPITVIHNGNELVFDSSEALYQSLAFSHIPEHILEIQAAKTAYASKIVAYERISERLPHWNNVKVSAMAFTLSAKLQSSRFQTALQSTSSMNIIEISKTDEFWGAVPLFYRLRGRNMLGNLLMQLRNGARLDHFEIWSLPV
jgi:ribA/ribD-fused uncharacterized protein